MCEKKEKKNDKMGYFESQTLSQKLLSKE